MINPPGYQPTDRSQPARITPSPVVMFPGPHSPPQPRRYRTSTPRLGTLARVALALSSTGLARTIPPSGGPALLDRSTRQGNWCSTRASAKLGAVSVGRLVGLVVLILVLYAIVTAPLSSASMARSGGSALGSAGTSLAQFVSSLSLPRSSRGSTPSRAALTSRSATGAYTVRAGDTLAGIAAAHATSASALAARNGLPDPNRITPGQRLSLP